MIKTKSNRRIFPLLLAGAILLWGCSGTGSTAKQTEKAGGTVPAVTTPVQEGPPSPADKPAESPKTEAAMTAEPSSTPAGSSPTPEDDNTQTAKRFADVIAVKANGSGGAYNFSVSIQSPDTGCDQYANWWEVLDESGELLYRRILFHSHVDEQPFTRSGGPVPVDADTIVFVRAHMHFPDGSYGYGGALFKGTPAGGFEAVDMPADFAARLEQTPPLPDGCAF